MCFYVFCAAHCAYSINIYILSQRETDDADDLCLLSDTAAVVGITVAIGVDTLDTDEMTDADIGRMEAIARVSVALLRTGCTERMQGCCDAIGRMFAFRGAECCSEAASDTLKRKVTDRNFATTTVDGRYKLVNCCF